MHKINAFFSWFSRPRQQNQVLLIKGSYYYDADRIDATGQFSLNMPLQLRPEPDNEYDRFGFQTTCHKHIYWGIFQGLMPNE